MKTKEIFMYVLGAIIVIGFFVTLIFMIQKEKYESEVNMIVGALIGSFITVVGFFYGSSKGSADKTDLLTKNKAL
ncbi:MAG TPA: hypothetical protein VK982_04345 [Bacteroidales bacterium]|nr:hypothetical protein [Bacteroidales bacterium]